MDDMSAGNEEIGEILKNWGYDEEIINKFKEQGIMVKHLPKISEFTLEKIFPKGGDRNGFFFEKIENLKKVTREVPTADENRNVQIYENLNYVRTPVPIKRPRLTQSLDSVLNSTPEGMIIMAHWQNEGKLTDLYRQKLGDEIIREELKADVEKRKFWAGSTQGTLRSTSAGRGILLARYYNMRRKLLKSGVIRKSSVALGSETSTSEVDDPISEEVEDAIQWLKNNSRTVASVIDKWQLSSVARVKHLRESNQTVHEYIDEFKVLKLSDAYTLLEVDFENHYPGSSLKLYTEWISLSCFIMSKVTVKERESVEDIFTSDGKKAKTTRLLHSLFNVKTVFCKGRKQWRPSRHEARDGLLQYVKTQADLLPAVNEKRKKLKDLGIQHVPQALLVSTDEDTIDSCHVVINQVWYNVDSPLKALDVAFRAMHMLDTPYPKECYREMLFLQLAIYDFTTKEDKKLLDTKTTALIEEYKQFKSSK